MENNPSGEKPQWRKSEWRITQVENESKAKTQVEGRHEPLLDLAVLRIYTRSFFSKHFV